MYKGVDYLIKRKACLGCGLCIKQHYSGRMYLSESGYYYPSSNAPIDDKMKKYCPGYSITQKRKKQTKEELLYGPLVLPVMSGYITDKELNFKASSGGVITALLITLFREKMIDSVLQVRESQKDPLKTEAFLSMSESDVMNCMGSRYAPCSLFENLDHYLNIGDRIAVVGKPCDIAALKAYMKVYPEKTKNIVYTFSMMCMGLPSYNATKELVRFLGVDQQHVEKLRYRGYGWPGKATIKTTNGNVKSCTYIQSWGAILGRDTLFRCKLCPNGFGEFADITCGDAWHVKDGEPVFETDDNGKSLIFVRSEQGKQLLDKAIANGILCVNNYNIKDLPLIQKSQFQRKKYLFGRYLLYRLLISPTFRIQGFHLTRLLSTADMPSLWNDSRGFLGRWWRDYKGKKRNHG